MSIAGMKPSGSHRRCTTHEAMFSRRGCCPGFSCRSTRSWAPFLDTWLAGAGTSTSPHTKRIEGFERSRERQGVPTAVCLVRSADQEVGEVRFAGAVVIECGTDEVALLDLESVGLEQLVENGHTFG